LDSAPDEIILAQEQGVINHGVGMVQEMEAAIEEAKNESEGTLLLTNENLVYVKGNIVEKMPEAIGGLSSLSKSIVYADIDDISQAKSDPSSIWIPINAIVSATGHKRIAQSPKLQVTWNDGTKKQTEFIEQVTGGSRRKNLNDWAPVIMKLKEGKQQFKLLPAAPSDDTVEGKVFRVMSDYDERGPLTIELEVEKRYGVDLELEEVSEACDKLLKLGLIETISAKNEEPFYAKVSPLGPDSLEA
jgi:hypothetical protein